MNGKILTVSTVLAAMLFIGCGGSDKSTRSVSTTLGDNIGLSTKSVATTQQTPTLSTKSTLQTGTEFTISKDIKKDTVIGKVESDKFDGEILSLSLCGDCANYFSIDENGTLKLECDLPEDFGEATLKVKANVKKDGTCKNVEENISIKIVKNVQIIFSEDTTYESFLKLSSPNTVSNIVKDNFIIDKEKGVSFGHNTTYAESADWNNNYEHIVINVPTDVKSLDITFSGSYDKEGIGDIFVQDVDTKEILFSLHDGWTNDYEGQSLTIKGKKLYEKKKINEVNRKETIELNGTKKLWIGMAGYEDYQYNRRFIKSLVFNK